jgi:hypothetical protein
MLNLACQQITHCLIIAFFLKNDDGYFNYPAAMAALFFLFLICWVTLQLYKALKNGSILFGIRSRGIPIKLIRREFHPIQFWGVFAFYCLNILLYIILIIVICFGLMRRVQL